MKMCLPILLYASVATGCAVYPPLSDDCNGSSGLPPTKITYGDSQIVVKPKSQIKAGREFQFKLDPKRNADDPVDYRDVLVTVKGKDEDPNSSWIDGSSTYNMAGSGHTFFGGCVPEAAEVGDVFSYEVTVEKVGVLDPRAEVVR